MMGLEFGRRVGKGMSLCWRKTKAQRVGGEKICENMGEESAHLAKKPMCSFNLISGICNFNNVKYRK